MKILASLVLGFCLFLLLVNPVSSAFAQTPTIAQEQIETAHATTTQEDSVGMLHYLIAFLEGIDKYAAGGLVFTTPDVFGDTITFPGGGEITGFGNFRTVFGLIAVSIIALILAVMGSAIMLDDGVFQTKPLLLRLLLTGGMLVGIPFFLSLTIQGTNLLNQQILLLGAQSSVPTDFSELLVAILTDMAAQIASGADPVGFAIPTVQISLLGNTLQSTALFLFELFILIITVLFFLFGFLFILFQFIIRFVSLIFLSILYPLVVPFMLSAKTEGIVKAYFTAWIGFLIHQPAFILGYMIVLVIFNSLLNREGASLGMLFFYSGALFFLGGVNVLINRIFGEPWTAIGTSIQTAAALGAMSRPVTRFKEGMVGGNVKGFASLAGRSFAQRSGWLSKNGKDFNFRGAATADSEQNGESSEASGRTAAAGSRPKSSRTFTPELSGELRQKGVGVDVLDKKTGAVNIKQTQGYAYTDAKTGLTTKYFSKEDALKDGRSATDLKQTTIEGKHLDYSAFYKTGQKNPYNTYTGKVKKETGDKGNPHVKFTSSEDRISDHLRLGRDKFKSEGVSGIIGKRYGNKSGKSGERIIRVYTRE